MQTLLYETELRHISYLFQTFSEPGLMHTIFSKRSFTNQYSCKLSYTNQFSCKRSFTNQCQHKHFLASYHIRSSTHASYVPSGFQTILKARAAHRRFFLDSCDPDAFFHNGLWDVHTKMWASRIGFEGPCMKSAATTVTTTVTTTNVSTTTVTTTITADNHQFKGGGPSSSSVVEVVVVEVVVGPQPVTRRTF